MDAENLLGLAVAVLGYLVYALLVPSGSDERRRLAPARRAGRLIVVGTRLLGPYLARVCGGAAPGDRVFLPVERLSTGSAGSTRARAAVDGLRALAARVQRRLRGRPLPPPARPGLRCR